eukprot:TRINITY_DN2331_c0_g1_i5.p1 TRINITY_DN2331_c0_g1~~TRINITY_DN2331_c0_g1_i5.p1  ORF type:complete len:109 (+),score=11.75 TRINITY_DN2331_c0_g1_i5:402-728(+)
MVYVLRKQQDKIKNAVVFEHCEMIKNVGDVIRISYALSFHASVILVFDDCDVMSIKSKVGTHLRRRISFLAAAPSEFQTIEDAQLFICSKKDEKIDCLDSTVYGNCSS